MKKQILTFIAVFAVMYLMFSFTHLSFDFSKWSEYNRFTYLFSSSFLCWVSFAITNKIT